MSRNPIPASKEGLNLIFEEMKRRWDASEKVKLDLKAEAERGSRLIRGSRVRREIWIRGEGARRVHRTTSASGCTGEPLDQDLAALSVADLNKKFINTFLHLHVRLYWFSIYTLLRIRPVKIVSVLSRNTKLQEYRNLQHALTFYYFK
jgi:hypothetical protein